MITAKKFKKATGYAPKDDDLDRCNCPKAGQIGHINCGWDHDMGKPEFIAVALSVKPTPSWPAQRPFDAEKFHRDLYTRRPQSFQGFLA